MTANGFRWTLVISLAWLPISCSPRSSHNDWLILPGQRVGPIRHNTSQEDLIALFGEDHVTQTQVDLGEGNFVSGTTVFPEVPEQRLTIVWADGRRDRISEIRIQGTVSKWRTPEGVTLGTTLKKLEELNGKAFSLAGYGWDRSGIICGMNQGALTDLEYDPDKPAGRKMTAQLVPDPGRQGLTEKVLGDRIFSSDHPVMQQMNPKVGSLEIRLD